ncbi:MAG: hypothetical protein AAFN59_06180 [Pseudomonadota bacterium]
MDAISQTDATRLQRRSARAACACRITGVAIPLLLAVSWALGGVLDEARFQLGLSPDQARPLFQTAVAAFLSLIPALATARALFWVATCFDGFAAGDWFGSSQPEALARAGRWLMIGGVAAMLVPTLIGLVLSIDAAPGARVLALTISSNAVLGVLFGALFWILGHLWAMAREIAVENARFV